LTGLLTGLCVRGRGALGTLYGMSALAVLTAGLYFVLNLLSGPVGDPGGEGVLGGLLVCQCIFWLPIGTAFAAVGGWLRRRIIFTPPRLALK
jgi:hypothetical protein